MKLKPGSIYKSILDDNNTWYLLISQYQDSLGQNCWECETFNHITRIRQDKAIFERSIDTRKSHIPDSVFNTFERSINSRLDVWKSVMSGFRKAESKN
jgi:hypothetical protein